MYQALYRKYRPLVFEDVVGQEHVVNTVKNQIVNNKISHAYMFTGTRGTGKTTCAKILARAVNCENPVDGNPCNECETCKGILNGSLLDVFEIDAASNNGVDNIRELRDDVIFTPASAKFKVYIIDEVHMLSTAAFNALLKTLEEPPAHIIFIFATTEIHKVPQTILSRCQRFDFKRITIDDICKRLNFVAAAEGFQIEANACSLIANLADGAMRDALSILDRCVDGSPIVSLEKVERTVGVCAYDEIITALESIVNSDTDSILRFYAQSRKKSNDTLVLFSELCSYLRDMLVIKLTKEPSEFLAYGEDKIEALKQISEKFTVEMIIRAIGILQSGIYDVSKFKDKHIMAEMTLIKLTNFKIGFDADSFNARLSALESGAAIAPAMQSVNEKQRELSPSAIKDETEKPKKQVIAKAPAGSDDLWNNIIAELPKNKGMHLLAFIKNIDHSVNDGSILLKCSKNDFAYSVLSQQMNVELIRTIAKNISGKDYSVVFTDKEIVKNIEHDSLSELLENADDILYEE